MKFIHMRFIHNDQKNKHQNVNSRYLSVMRVEVTFAFFFIPCSWKFSKMNCCLCILQRTIIVV